MWKRNLFVNPSISLCVNSLCTVWHLQWLSGLWVQFLLRVQEVSGSKPGWAQNLIFFQSKPLKKWIKMTAACWIRRFNHSAKTAWKHKMFYNHKNEPEGLEKLPCHMDCAHISSMALFIYFFLEKLPCVGLEKLRLVDFCISRLPRKQFFQYYNVRTFQCRRNFCPLTFASRGAKSFPFFWL